MNFCVRVFASTGDAQRPLSIAAPRQFDYSPPELGRYRGVKKAKISRVYLPTFRPANRLQRSLGRPRGVLSSERLRIRSCLFGRSLDQVYQALQHYRETLLLTKQPRSMTLKNFRHSALSQDAPKQWKPSQSEKTVTGQLFRPGIGSLEEWHETGFASGECQQIFGNPPNHCFFTGFRAKSPSFPLTLENLCVEYLRVRSENKGAFSC